MKNPPATILLAFSLTGCTSTQIFMLPEDGPAFTHEVALGTDLQLVTTRGESHDFALAEIGTGGVCGPAACFDYPDVATIEVKQFSAAKTGGLAVGTLVALVLAAAAAVGSIL
ncbi:MAG: hypothetical protein AAGE01_22045 [Pseudomonadota bacterium]